MGGYGLNGEKSGVVLCGALPLFPSLCLWTTVRVMFLLRGAAHYDTTTAISTILHKSMCGRGSGKGGRCYCECTLALIHYVHLEKVVHFFLYFLKSQGLHGCSLVKINVNALSCSM